ncbi:MAG: S9 family peptidase, partial [Gemmatimonadota bacterium]
MHDASSPTRPATTDRTGPRRPDRAPRSTARVLALLVGALFLGIPAFLSAQDTDPGERSPVGVEDYGKWERLGGATLSSDGAWIAYGVDRVEEDDELRIRPLGSAGGPGPAEDSLITITHGESPAFSEDGRWLAYLVTVDEDEAEASRERDEPVRDDLGLLDLASGDTTLAPGVRDFSFSDDGRFLSMARYGPAERDPDGEGPQGVDLVVRDLVDGTDTRFGNVASHAWQDEGSLLAMTIDAEGRIGNGIRVYDPTTGELRTLESRTTRYTGLAWREDADDLAALRRRGAEGHEDSTHVILAWSGLADGSPEASVFDPREMGGFEDSLRVVDYRTPTWSDDGETLFFGVKTRDEAPMEDEEAAAEDTADVDEPSEGSTGEGSEDEEDPADVEIWHAGDIDIVPRQKVTRQQDQRENHLAAWPVGADTWVRLGTGLTEEVEVVEGTGLALGFDATPYEPDRMFGPEHRDVYVIDVKTGERDRVLERVQYFYGASPGGEHLLYLRDDRYWSHHVPTGRTTDLTGDLPTTFVDLEDDHTVEQKPPYGVAGWLEGGDAVLLYDRHDVWRVSPDGDEAARITSGAADSVEHRWIRLDDEDDEPGIDPTGPLYFRLYHEWQEASGIARLEPGADEPERLLWMEKQVRDLQKAEDADVYVWRQEDWGDSPDLFVGGPELADPAQVSRT